MKTLANDTAYSFFFFFLLHIIIIWMYWFSSHYNSSFTFFSKLFYFTDDFIKRQNYCCAYIWNYTNLNKICICSWASIVPAAVTNLWLQFFALLGLLNSFCVFIQYLDLWCLLFYLETNQLITFHSNTNCEL